MYDLHVALFSKINKEGNEKGCWLWIGGMKPNGYGGFYDTETKKMKQAHRFVYEYYGNTIPDGYELDHLCMVKACVNPNHMEPVTPKENKRRSNSAPANMARRKECARGHEYTILNTGFKKYKHGYSRECLICKSINRKKYYKKKKA